MISTAVFAERRGHTPQLTLVLKCATYLEEFDLLVQYRSPVLSVLRKQINVSIIPLLFVFKKMAQILAILILTKGNDAKIRLFCRGEIKNHWVSENQIQKTKKRKCQ